MDMQERHNLTLHEPGHRNCRKPQCDQQHPIVLTSHHATSPGAVGVLGEAEQYIILHHVDECVGECSDEGKHRSHHDSHKDEALTIDAVDGMRRNFVTHSAETKFQSNRKNNGNL